MTSNEKVLKGYKSGNNTVHKNLNISATFKNCFITIKCENKTFLSDGVDYFDAKGNKVSKSQFKKLMGI